MMKCAPRTEPPGVLRVEAGEVPRKGVQSEDQWNKVQCDVQVPGGPGGPEGRGKRDRGLGGPGLWGAPACIG